MKKYSEIDYKEVGARIKAWRGDMNQTAFGRKYGKSYTDIGRIERGEVKPTPDLLFKICIDYEKTVEEILTGEEPETVRAASCDRVYMTSAGMKSRSEIIEAMKIPEDRFEDWLGNNEFSMIPVARGEISAGGGLVADETVEMKIAFRRDWIARRGDPQRMSLIRVSGDSMEPTLYSGDLVLIDHNRNAVDPHGGIYAIALDNEIMIKRLQLRYPQKALRIISDNARYETFDAPQDEVIINGKVIWFGRELER